MQKLSAPYFKWKGATSTSKGVYMISMPTRGAAVLNGQKANNLGRDGFTFYDEGGYGAITIKCDVVIPDNDNLDAALAWLNGSGQLTFSDDPNKHWDAMIITSYNRTSPFKRLEGQKMTVTWTCQPFRYLNTENTITLTSTGMFSGQGHVPSRPLIQVSGSSSSASPATLSIVDNNLQTNTMQLVLTSGTSLYIDCDAKAAYTMSGGAMIYAGQNVMIAAGSDWFELRPAGTTNNNSVTMSGGITQVVITPRWRFL
jgi:phage-related protein